MRSILLPMHLVFAGVWLGCVITEALFERALLNKGREQERILAMLHKRVDLFVEVPALLIVLVTGVLLLVGTNASPWLRIKIGFGIFAIAANCYCVWLVFHRATAAVSGDWQAFARLDSLQHKIGGAVALCMLIALGIGLFIYATA